MTLEMRVKLDHSALVTVLEEMAKTEVRRKWGNR